ncbi:MAG: flippase [Candidatus Helarchaeota archaeon]
MSIRNFRRNIIFISVGWLLPNLTNFVTLPYIVSGLGKESYGVIAIIMNVAGYAAFMDLGLGHAGVKYISHYNSLNKRDMISRVMGNNELVSMIMGMTGLILMLTFSRYLVTKVFNIDPSIHDNAVIVFWIGGLSIACNIMMSVYRAVPKSLQKFYITNIINAVIGVLSPIAMLVLIWFGAGLVLSFLGRIIVSLLGFIIFLFFAKYLLPHISFKLRFDPSLFKRLFSFGGYTTINTFMSRIAKQVDLTLVGILISASAVTYYTPPFLLARAIQGFCLKLAELIFPSISELNAQNKIDEIQDIFFRASRYMLTLGLLLTVPLIVCTKEILNIWMGADFVKESSLVMQIMLITALLHIFGGIPFYIILGMGKSSIVAVTGVLLGSISILLGMLLIPVLGIEGAAFSQLGAGLLIVPGLAFYVGKYIGINQLNFLKLAIVKPILSGILSFVMATILFDSSNINIDKIFVLLIKLILSFIIIILLSLLIGAIKRSDIELAIKLIK